MDILVTVTDWAPRVVAACGLVALIALLGLVTRAGSRRSGGKRRTFVLIAIAGVVVGLALYVPAWLRFEAQRTELRNALSSLRAEVKQAEARIEGIRKVIGPGHGPGQNIAAFLGALAWVAPDAALPEASATAAEAQLRAVASHVGLTVQSIQHEEKRSAYIESAFTIAVEGAPGAVQQFATLLGRLARPHRVDEIVLRGKTGTVRVSVFSRVRPRQASEACLALPAPDPHPPVLLTLEKEREELRGLCHKRGQVAWALVNDDRGWRDLIDLALERWPAPRIENAVRPAGPAPAR